MCHRFELYQTPKVIKLLEGTGFSVKEPRIFNPGDIAPVLAMDRNLKPRVFFMKWGYSIYDKLGVDDDPDVEKMLENFEKITEELCYKMFDYGWKFAKEEEEES